MAGGSVGMMSGRRDVLVQDGRVGRGRTRHAVTGGGEGGGRAGGREGREGEEGVSGGYYSTTRAVCKVIVSSVRKEERTL